MLKKFYWQFLDEIEGVNEYVQCAMKYQDDRPDLSKMYQDMASNECTHAERLHQAAKKYDDRKAAEDENYHKSDLVEIMGEQLMKARAFLSALD